MGKKWIDSFPRTQLHEESLNITNQGNGNQNYNEILSIIMALSKRWKITNVGEDVAKGEHLIHSWCISTVENTIGVPLKLKIKLKYNSAILLPDIYLTEMKSLSFKDTCIFMFIIELSTKIWKQRKYLLIGQWTQKSHPHTYTYTHKHTHTSVVFIHKKEGNPTICNNMNEPWGHYAKERVRKRNAYDTCGIQKVNHRNRE